jgi:hypothetical protein
VPLLETDAKDKKLKIDKLHIDWERSGAVGNLRLVEMWSGDWTDLSTQTVVSTVQPQV